MNLLTADSRLAIIHTRTPVVPLLAALKNDVIRSEQAGTGSSTLVILGGFASDPLVTVHTVDA